MSADPLLSRWTAPARRQGMASDLLTGLPGVLVATALAWRFSGATAAILVALAGLFILGGVAWRRGGRFDRRWLVRELDRRPAMADSTDLLFAAPDRLNPLQRLQRARLERELAAASEADLAPRWRTRPLAILWAIGLALVAAILFWPDREEALAATPIGESGPVIPGVPRLVAQRLAITPPPYTGLPPTAGGRLNVKAPAGSVLRWTLRFDPQPAGAALAFLDGSRLPLVRQGETWTATRRLDRSLLYRVVPQGGVTRPAPTLHRLEAVADAAPQVRVLTPTQTLTPIAAGQRDWGLAFEVRDDHGVAPTATLRITIAQGEGENVTFSERTMTLAGSGSRTVRRFAATLNFAALGFSAGGDLVAQLIAADNRPPVAQVVRSPSLILRWPSQAGAEASGLEGAVKKVMPAYFRSQRQIIIDAEALLKQRRRLSAEDFLSRSNTIGADQRLLRLRYGQFLGEEAEGEPKAPPPPTSDAPTADAPAEVHTPDDGHDHGAGGAPSPTFGNAGNVLAEYGHTHDESEAATLLDPKTRTLLKNALDNMWSSELHLRQGDPQVALPYAYKALGFIKQVQQATRIFLARVGPDLPPVDPARRMTGKREGLASRQLMLDPRDGVDAVPAAVWRTLGAVPAGTPVRLGPLSVWARGAGSRGGDPLALAAAIDAVEREPGCGACREKLRGLIWKALARPPVNVTRRVREDAVGRRYLEALR